MDHNHIIAVNLKISNNELRKLFSKGPKYRENKTIYYTKAKKSIITGMKSFIKSWCNKHDVTISSLSQWKQTAISATNKEINHLTTKLTTKNIKNKLGLKDKIVTEKLKLLHNQFVVVSIDHVSGNVAFFCQRHYAQVLINELGLSNVNAITTTFLKAIKPVEKIVSNNTSFLKDKFNLEIDEINDKIR